MKTRGSLGRGSDSRLEHSVTSFAMSLAAAERTGWRRACRKIAAGLRNDAPFYEKVAHDWIVAELLRDLAEEIEQTPFLDSHEQGESK